LAFIDFVSEVRGMQCNICDKELSTWDIKCSKALAYKSPVCESCIAKEYDNTVEEIRGTMAEYFGERPCMGL
jgi:hypothetical protein